MRRAAVASLMMSAYFFSSFLASLTVLWASAICGSRRSAEL